MSSTRYAADDSEIQQQRWASSPDFSTSVSALLAAKRISLVADSEFRDLLWFVQWCSLKARGLRRLAEEIITKFPDCLGTPAMRRLRLRPGKKLSSREVVELRREFPDGLTEFLLRDEIDRTLAPGDLLPYDPPEFYRMDDFIAKVSESAEELHEHLLRLCVDPATTMDSDPWYFGDLLGALRKHRSDYRRGGAVLADTESTRQINAALDFCLRRRRMVLIEGKAGIGKSETLKAWCERQSGLARYVEVPSSNDDRSFFAAVAESIGVARGTSYNGQQIKLRVEEALRESGLMLALDEAQFAWPQYMRPQGIPSRIQWIKTMFDADTPIALVALPKFSEWRQLYASRTLWDDDQLERRINRTVRLPDAHSKEDLLKIARARHPGGNRASWMLLTGYALAAAKRQASAITEALESAFDIANQDGRDSITYDDIEAAVKLDFQPIPVSAVPVRKPAKARPMVRHERVKIANLHADRDAILHSDRLALLSVTPNQD